MSRVFGNLKMGWLTVALFAMIAGTYTGLVMLVSALKETSFQDIGVSYEWWVIFAVIIVVNCKKNWEAMLKCFVFFLISQPLVYIVEVLFGSLSAPLAWMYYSRIWLPMTILTLPGGFLAFYCKKQNMVGSILLGIGNTIQTLMGVTYLIHAITDFPHHLLSALISFLSIIVMSCCIQKEKRYRFLAILIPILLTALLIVILKARGLSLVSNVF